MKNEQTAYCLWLFGGIFGLHHIYLGREAHAFIMFSTFGGFLIGWLADYSMIPTYVQEANSNEEFEEIEEGPVEKMCRGISSVVLAYYWGNLVLMAIPLEKVGGIYWTFLHWFVPLAVALAIWIVSFVHKRYGPPFPAILAAYMGYLMNYDFMAMIPITLVTYQLSRRLRGGPMPIWPRSHRFAIWWTCCFIYLCLWGSFFYYNGEIRLHSRITYPLHKRHVLDSLNTLELLPFATDQHVSTRWRKLSNEYNPAKFEDEEAKRIAKDMFSQVQRAHMILSQTAARTKHPYVVNVIKRIANKLTYKG